MKLIKAMTHKYVKKPIPVEAVQWTGDNRKDIWDFCSLSYFNYNIETDKLELFIQTLEGPMSANVGDYIIKGVKGEFYPCKEDIFNETYDQITE